MSPTTTYSCPIPDCVWTHRDEGPEAIAPSSELVMTPDEIHARNVLHQAAVEHAFRAHYETHEAEEWVRLVSKLHAELAARSQPLLCVGCLSDRWQAKQAGLEQPPLNAAVTVVEGNASCAGHVSFGAPQIPGRTAAGIITDLGPLNGGG